MPVETDKSLQENHFKKVVLLATDGTINTKFYKNLYLFVLNKGLLFDICSL